MRHLTGGVKRFGRHMGHRKALFKNLVTSLLKREQIRTTLAKAKELRRKVEKVITLGKKGSLHHRRLALRHVTERDVVGKVFGPLSERYASRPGGYTRIIRLGHRPGDNAPMALIELVDREAKKSAAKTGEAEAQKPAAKKTAAKKEPAEKTAKKAPAKKEAAEKKAEKKPAKGKKES